jgi:predicted outer membrane repeat protein
MQIAGFLNWFHFKGAAAETVNVPTLSIAAGKTAAFIGTGGAGGAAQRLVLGGTSGAVNTEAGAGFVIDGASTVAATPGGSNGGAVSVTAGGKLHFDGTDANNFTFSNNVSAGTGGAIYSDGTDSAVTFSDGTAFIKNSAATGGGAIYAAGGSTVTLTDAIFDGNTTTGAGSKGGAIYNSGGTVALNVGEDKKSVFSGNKANNAANAIHIEAAGTLAITTAAGGTLYTFDPITASTAAIITKGGAGTWRVAGTSALTDSAVSINDGTVYLYKTGEAEQVFIATAIREVNGALSDYSLSATAAAGVIGLTTGTFTLGANATLVLSGAGSAVTTSDASGAVTLEAGSEVIFNIGSTAPTGNGVISTNNLDVSGAKLTLNFSQDFLRDADAETVLQLFSGASGGLVPVSISGEFATITAGGPYEWAVNYGTGEVYVFGEKVVPEPGTYALWGAIGAVGLALLRRRRKSKN